MSRGGAGRRLAAVSTSACYLFFMTAPLVTTAAIALCPRLGLLELALDGWLDGWRELLAWLVAWLATGGIALALGASVIFIATWVLSHLRSARVEDDAVVMPTRLLPWLALLMSYVPVLLTVVAALGLFVPGLTPLILKLFAVAVIAAAATWVVAVGALLAGGADKDLRRARRALLLAGTPWYALALYLATWL